MTLITLVLWWRVAAWPSCVRGSGAVLLSGSRERIVDSAAGVNLSLVALVKAGGQLSEYEVETFV